MLFFPHQEPPPKPPATVQTVQATQKAQDAADTSGSLVGPPKSLMASAKIDFRKLEERFYVEVVVIEGQAEPMLKMPLNYAVTLPKGMVVWYRQPRSDLKYARMIPFWMSNYHGFTPYNNQTFGGSLWNFPMGWGY